MRIELFGFEFVLQRIRGNDQMVSIPLKDHQKMKRELQIRRLRT